MGATTTYLQWSACEKQPMWRCIMSIQHLSQLAVMILHAMTFIDDHVLPTNLQHNGRTNIVS